MEGIFEILLNALPEAIGGLIAAGIIALLSYLFVKRLRKESLQEKAPQELLNEPPVPEIYSNLPSRTEFIGRKKEMERIRAALSSRYFLICIDGIGGIGKTSLALEVIHECLRFSKGEIRIEEDKQAESAIPKFDGFIWTSAKDRELRLNDILDAIARTLDWPGIAQQPYLEKIESVRKLLQTKRFLLIVDNFETITDEAVRDFLLKIPEPSKALITSREQKLPQAWAVSIKGLEQDEALALIRNEGQRLGLKSVEDADDQVLLRLYQATGGAPLAIKWSVGQIKQKGQSLDTVLAALHEAKGDIFEEVFARSWSLLSEDAQKVLMVMPIFAASASRDAIEAASDVHHFALDEALGQLVQMWLVEVTDELESAKRRYSVHPLTRAFGEQKLKAYAKFEEIIGLRVCIYFNKFVRKYGEENLLSFDHLEGEKDNIFRIIDWCFRKCLYDKVIQLSKGLYWFLALRGYWHELIQYGQIGLDSAKVLDDKKSISLISRAVLGWTYLKMSKYEEAEQVIKKGIEIAEEIKDQQEIGRGLRFLGKVAREKIKMHDAKLIAEKSLVIALKHDEKTLENHLYSDLGHIAFYYGDYDLAEKMFFKALSGFRNLGDDIAIALKLVHLGYVLFFKKQLNEARNTFNESIAISQKYGRKETIARAKFGLAKISEQMDNYKEALNQVTEAYTLFEKLGMKKFIDESQEMIDRLEKKIGK